MSRDPWISGLAEAFINNALSALGAGARAMENPGEFLRDDLPPGTDGLTSWIQDRNRRACRLHARNEAAGLYSDLGALRRPRYGHCKPYLDSIDEGPTSEGGYAPPFTGGQCQQFYNVTASGPNRLGAETSFTAGVVGPVGGLIQQNSAVPGLVANYIQGSTAVDDPTPFLWFINPVGLHPEDASQWSITGVSPLGHNQNCGDPPPEYRPPGYPTGLPPLPPTTIAPPGGDGGDDIEVDPDGNWRFCENGDCTPWFTPGGGGTPADPGGEEDGDPQETNPNDPNNPNEISGCVEDGKVLVGLKINVIAHPITYDGNDSIYYRVGWIWMGPNENQLDLTVDGATIRDGQFVFPDGPDCLCYTVRANPGFRLSVQAFSRPREENNSE